MVISLFQQSGGGGSSGDKIGIAPPTISSTGLTYDGTAKSPVIGPYNEDAVAISYTPQVNAGTYSCTIALRDKSKYVWLDTYDTDNKTANWTVAKASGSSSLSKYAVELEEGGSNNVVVTRAGDGEIIATSADTSIATVSVSGNIVTISDGGTEGTTSVSISVAAGTNYNAVGAKTVTVEVSHGPEIVTWANGTDAQIVAMCEASDEGKLDLWDCWNVGDYRDVSLSAMTKSYVSESQPAANIRLVIVNKGGYHITNGGISAFIVQQRKPLPNDGVIHTSSSSVLWSNTNRSQWCNDTYKNAFPSTIKSIFKQVRVYFSGSTGNIGRAPFTNQYFFLPSELEICYYNENDYVLTALSNQDEKRTVKLWDFYNTVSYKKMQNYYGSGYAYWWTRSLNKNSSTKYNYISSDGTIATNTVTTSLSIAPAGCIGTVNNGSGTVIPSWETSTDAQIVDIIAKADAGEIDLTDYWNVGDKRAITLSSISATDVGESHKSQTIYMVLVDKNNQNYQYVTATSGRTYCSFIVQQEDPLQYSQTSGDTRENGYMNSSNTNSGGWNACARRTWCNNRYKNAIPASIRSIFKQVTVKTMNGGNQSDVSLVTSNDYFFLPAAKEVFTSSMTQNFNDSYAYSNPTEWNSLSTWEYYSKTFNKAITYRTKCLLSTSRNTWWLRSPARDYNNCFCKVQDDANVTPFARIAGSSGGIAPCGCI